MTIKGIDVSENQPPNFPWEAALAAGVRFAYIRASVGYRADIGYPKHRERARSLGILTGSYHAILRHNPPNPADTHPLMQFDPVQQAHAFASVIEPGDELPPAVDVEAADVDDPELWAFISARPVPRLVIYTSQSAWYRIVGRGAVRYARFPLWAAQYGNNLLPDIWTGATIKQTTGTGRIPGYANDLDLDEFQGDEAAFALFTGKAAPVTVPVIVAGPKVGLAAIQPSQAMPLVRRALAAGWAWPVVKSTDNAGLMLDVRRESPASITLYRHVNKDLDGAQDVATWTAERRAATAAVVLAAAVDPLSAAERAAIDFWELVNEADPPGADGWAAYGLYLCELVRQAEARGLHVALPAFSAGTPEWGEMQALANTGLFGLLKAGGHILTAHEGVFGASDPLAAGAIPGAPSVPGAGPLCWRYRYLLAILRARGEAVPIVVSEFYAGGGYSDFPGMLARLAQYDHEIRKDPEVLAVLPFTVDPDAGWRGSDYTPFYGSAELWSYIAAERGLPNATGDNTMPITKADKQAMLDQANALATGANTQLAGANALIGKIAAIVTDDAPLYQARALIDLVLRDKDGNPTTDPLLAPTGSPGGVVKAGTIVPVYAHLVGAGTYTNRDTVTLDGKNVWGVATALQRV